MAENLIITVNNGTRNISKNLTNINPSTADSDLTVVASALNGLTTNTLVNLERVVRNSIALPVTAKASPNLSASPTDANMGTDATIDVTVTRLGDGAISVSGYSGSYEISGTAITFNRFSSVDFKETVTISVAETDEYAAASTTITVSGRPGGSMPMPE